MSSGVLPEPLITFGGHRYHVDPKAGLEEYGPYAPVDDPSEGSRSISVGIVGPAELVGKAERWLDACTRPIKNVSSNPFQSPSFPGFSMDSGFRSTIHTSRALQHSFAGIALGEALKRTAGPPRVAAVAALYVEGIKIISERDQRPDVVLCCISGDIYKGCLIGAPEKLAHRRKILKVSKGSDIQLGLFPSLDEETDVETYLDLWKAVKAGAMQHSVPTQLLLESTMDLEESRETQDLATRAWNFSVALYHKSGGSPWRLANIDSDVCFVGISFFRDAHAGRNHVEASVAQAFTAAGDGYVLRGQSFDWSPRHERDKTPHMDRATSAALIRAVIEQYKRQHNGHAPARLVVHKSSLYWAQELDGLREGAEGVPRIDLVAFRRRDIQLFREGAYPPLRGTYAQLGRDSYLLYTKGYIPYFATYPGARAPQPLEIAQHVGDSAWTTVLSEILALTKMNWNSADFSAGVPITLSFSRRVGAVLAELHPDHEIRPEYRFYM